VKRSMWHSMVSFYILHPVESYELCIEFSFGSLQNYWINLYSAAGILYEAASDVVKLSLTRLTRVPTYLLHAEGIFRPKSFEIFISLQMHFATCRVDA
jgi:hypothetical protein